ncbi:MAG: FMN-binding protein [Gammaproteobacteria bacterium]|nr:FMN-binding protein [Gammaproteobacteria bacterium]MDH3482276.1 FMN-binding protein [Gammaproteobacteria bacterium]
MNLGAQMNTDGPGSLRLVMTLAIAGLISGIAIIGIYESTLPTITANKARELREAVFKVLPGVSEMQQLVYRDGQLIPTEERRKDEQAVYGGYDREGDFVGYAIPAAGPGFQDTIGLLYGYTPQRKQVLGMEVLESRETPGLGDKIYKDADFVGSFSQLSIDPNIIAVKKGTKSRPNEIDAITGATISSKAVVRIINEAHVEWSVRLPLPGAEPPLREAENASAGDSP